MELKQLKHMLAVAEHGNYARAAAVLGLTQSALSQSIARLEESVNARLFERGRHGAVLTEAGELLRLRARSILAEQRLATLELAGVGGAAHGAVTIGVGKDVACDLAPLAVSGFLARRPAVTVTVHEGWSPDLFRQLVLGELDFVVSGPAPGYAVHPEIDRTPLHSRRETVYIGKAHPLARRGTPALAQLARARWAVPPHGSGRVRALQQKFQTLGLEPPDRFVRTDSAALLHAMLVAGSVVAVTCAELVPWQHRDAVIAIDAPELAHDRTTMLAVRGRTRPHALAAALMQEFVTAARDFAPPESISRPPAATRPTSRARRT